MLRPISLLLTVFTGFSALVYEVAWQRFLATLLGSHSEATAAVLGLFLGGLALGYRLFGALTLGLARRAEARGRAPRLLRLYGLVEASIGAYALLFPILFVGVQALSFRIPHAPGGLGFGFDVALSAILIVPPAVLMGGTIPVLTQALARSVGEATRVHAWVYAFNTLGAFFGALAAGFVLVPRLGLVGCMVAMGVLNLCAGAAFLVLGGGERGAAPAPKDAATESPAGVAAYALVALLVGFSMMTVQTVLNRIGALAFGASHFTFAMVVAVFVLSIALGSLAVSALRRIGPRLIVGSQALLAVLLFLLYTPLPSATVGAWKLRLVFRNDDIAFYPYYLAAFACLLFMLALPVGLSGATLPLLFHHLRRQGAELGSVAGRLYAWNTLGSLLGALLGGYILFFWFDLHQVYRLAVAMLGVAVGVLAVRLLRAPAIATAALVVAPFLVALTLLSPWDPMLLSVGLFRERGIAGTEKRGATASGVELRMPFYVDDPIASIAVREWDEENGVGRAIMSNGKSDSAIPDDYPTTALIGLLPALLADRCERAFVVGYGTGVTAGELAALDSVREVVVAEISPGVMQAAPYFEEGNLGALSTSKVRAIRGDAYRLLMRDAQRYDVIASEPSNPWVTGVEMLYSREFLEAAKARLSPGGVYLQWTHTYESDTATVALVLRTLLSVFDRVAVWYALETDLLILGFADGAYQPDLARLERRASSPDYRAGLSRAGIEGIPELLAHELLPVGVASAARLEGPLHTLLHPRLSHSAARAFFRGDEAKLPWMYTPRGALLGKRNSLLRRYTRLHGGERMSDGLRGRVLDETCRIRIRQCATLLAAWLHEERNSIAVETWVKNFHDWPAGSAPLDFELVAELVALYDRVPEAGGSEVGAYARADRATDLFTGYYHHAAPFRRVTVLQRWRDCFDSDDRDRCHAGFQRARRHFGHSDRIPELDAPGGRG